MENWAPAITTDENIPEGWIFFDRGDGTLVPLCAWIPEEDLDQPAPPNLRR